MHRCASPGAACAQPCMSACVWEKQKKWASDEQRTVGRGGSQIWYICMYLYVCACRSVRDELVGWRIYVLFWSRLGHPQRDVCEWRNGTPSWNSNLYKGVNLQSMHNGFYHTYQKHKINLLSKAWVQFVKVMHPSSCCVYEIASFTNSRDIILYDERSCCYLT